MANTTYQARVQQKRDTAANWEKVKNTFQPLDGELIIVDTSAGKTRFKVGRYDSTKGRLLYYGEIPFADEYLYNDTNTAIGKVKDYVDEATGSAVQYTAQTLTDEQKTQARENIGVPSFANKSVLDQITGLVTEDNVLDPNNPTDLVQYAAFQKAVPIVQMLNITKASVGQVAKIAAVNGNGNPTRWIAADNEGGLPHPLILEENTDYGDMPPASPQEGQLFFKEAGTSLFDLIYPVGAVYISMNNTSPATLFGGSWTKIEGKFLLGTSSTYPTGSSGGEETHTLSVAEMPSHNHNFYLQRGSNTAERTALLEWAMSSQVAGWQTWQTDSTGGGQAHNNMPPYLAVNIWYRVS